MEEFVGDWNIALLRSIKYSKLGVDWTGLFRLGKSAATSISADSFGVVKDSGKAGDKGDISDGTIWSCKLGVVYVFKDVWISWAIPRIVDDCGSSGNSEWWSEVVANEGTKISCFRWCISMCLCSSEEYLNDLQQYRQSKDGFFLSQNHS